jgi:hypothetical protein
MNQIRKQVEDSGGKPDNIFEQAKASIEKMFGKTPDGGTASTTAMPGLLPSADPASGQAGARK